MFLTKSYKNGFIHYSTIGDKTIVRVQVDKFAYAIEVKNEHAAKILISKHGTKYGTKK